MLSGVRLFRNGRRQALSHYRLPMPTASPDLRYSPREPGACKRAA
jgi:hypothetical protein